MDDIYNKITELVKNNILDVDDNFVKFSDSGYDAVKFDKNNFSNIENIKSDNKIAFIDGGSSEILKSSNFSLNLIRIYYAVYFKNKRIKSGKNDFYSFTCAKNVNNEIYFDTEIIGIKNNIISKEGLLLSSLDETIKQGITRANISNMANLVRRFSEIKTAAKVVESLDENDIIVLDGSLQCTFTNEKKYLEELYENALRNKVIVCGLSKTTALMTDKGNSITSALNKFNFDGKWAYHPVADIKNENHQADIAFVKFHEKSKYMFRFEIFRKQKERIKDAINLISGNCKDPVFIGYPYGLVEADRSARISNSEKEMMLTFFSIKFGKEWEKIKDSLSSVDAHEILDSIG
ncbi:hypothetical protein CL615_01975 [archaeon]|jgi:hypothetical protein|nr:hypothetical protein [archaeon]MDP6547541.1 DNA double-strand break repair nuclease NurA [Candidatus Woesearchaeota archaeon]|tara:strand:+ start:1942 stop:2988 length:1047 start_codon:yes stop_codon:yes gene_type:complete